MGFLCKDPLCAEIEVDVKDLSISNTEYHGDLWCHIAVYDWMVESGAKDKVEAEAVKLRKKKKCAAGCACTSLEVASFTIKHSRHVHREHVYDSTKSHGNCRVSFDLEFKFDVRVYLGICHDPDFSKAGDDFAKLKDKLIEVGKKLEEIADPDEIWKRIGGVSPKALRESPSMEKPRRIRLRRRPSGGGDKTPPPSSSDSDSHSSLPPSLPPGLIGQPLEYALAALGEAELDEVLEYEVSEDEQRLGRVVAVEPFGERVRIRLAVREPRLPDIEQIGAVYNERIGMALAEFAESDVSGMEVEGVSEARLALWQKMGRWLLLAPFLDGNGAELIARGLELATPSEAKDWLADKGEAEIAAAIAEAAKKVKLPGEYLGENRHLVAAALRHGARSV